LTGIRRRTAAETACNEAKNESRRVSDFESVLAGEVTWGVEVDFQAVCFQTEKDGKSRLKRYYLGHQNNPLVWHAPPTRLQTCLLGKGRWLTHKNKSNSQQAAQSAVQLPSTKPYNSGKAGNRFGAMAVQRGHESQPCKGGTWAGPLSKRAHIAGR